MVIPAPWLQTYSGLIYNIMSPNLEHISIIDIAHSLSMQCRYNGHTKKFYSVAEHSCILCDFAINHDYPLSSRKWALMHDASETYLGDIIRPFKIILNGYQVYEDITLTAIAKKFELNLPIPNDIQIIDLLILNNERKHLLIPNIFDWGIGEESLSDIKIECWEPSQAKKEFTDRFIKLFYKDKVDEI